jgi:hypothetical protein
MNDELAQLMLRNQVTMMRALQNLRPLVGLPYERNLPLRKAVEETEQAFESPLTHRRDEGAF